MSSQRTKAKDHDDFEPQRGSYDIRFKIPAGLYRNMQTIAEERGETVASFARSTLADKVYALNSARANYLSAMMVQPMIQQMMEVFGEISVEEVRRDASEE